MNFIRKLIDTYNKGLEYESLQKRKQELQAKYNHLLKKLEEYKEKNNKYKDEIIKLKERINELKDELKIINKHSSLENYKKYLEHIPTKAQYYDFGKGRRRVHTVFANSLKDENIIRKFIEEYLEFNPEHDDTADELVFHFVRVFNNKLPTKQYYSSDEELYGKKEYWASAKETIGRIMKDLKKLFDCDDVMILIYSCLYYLLDDKFPDQKWRLRGFIVDLWGNLGGHALLGWVRGDDVNDFVPIETTFMDDKQGFMWTQKYRIRNQLFYQIRYSFDNENEYVKI